MRTLIASLLLLAPSAALSQVKVEVALPLPSIRFEVVPPVVVVAPEVQVVSDYEEEVFLFGGVYWCRMEGGWYRSADHRGNWVYVERDRVPSRLRGLPVGKYKHYKHKAHKVESASWKHKKDRDHHKDKGGKGKHKHK